MLSAIAWAWRQALSVSVSAGCEAGAHSPPPVNTGGSPPPAMANSTALPPPIGDNEAAILRAIRVIRGQKPPRGCGHNSNPNPPNDLRAKTGGLCPNAFFSRADITKTDTTGGHNESAGVVSWLASRSSRQTSAASTRGTRPRASGAPQRCTPTPGRARGTTA
jgi:hypothetical protein